MVTITEEVPETRSAGGINLSMIPQLDSGANWVDFERRLEEYLVMSGLGITMDPKCKPTKIVYPALAATEGTNAREASVESDPTYISHLATTSWGDK